jgi:hypothetical protein
MMRMMMIGIEEEGLDRPNGYVGLSGWYFDASLTLYSVNDLGTYWLKELLVSETD